MTNESTAAAAAVNAAIVCKNPAPGRVNITKNTRTADVMTTYAICLVVNSNAMRCYGGTVFK